MPYSPLMDRGLFLIRSQILDVESVRNSTFTGPNSAIISDFLLRGDLSRRLDWILSSTRFWVRPCLLIYTCGIFGYDFHICCLYWWGLVFVSWLSPSLCHEFDLLLIKTNWAGVYCVVVCTVALRANRWTLICRLIDFCHQVLYSVPWRCVECYQSFGALFLELYLLAWGFLEVIGFTVML